MQTRRIGLVLGGGGAKGAFQWGVITTLWKRGVRFSAVAGTSVGALNASLVSTEQFELGSEIYRRLCWRTLMPNGGKNLNWFRRAQIGMHILWGILANAYSCIPGPSQAGGLCTAVNWCLQLVSIAVIGGLLLLFGLWSKWLSLQHGVMMYVSLLPYICVIWLICKFGVYIYVNPSEFAFWGPKTTILAPLAASAAFLVNLPSLGIAYCIIGFLRVLAALLMRRSALSKDQLLIWIKDILSRPLNIPCFATTSTAIYFYDPENPSWTLDRGNVTKGILPRHILNLFPGYVAKYHELNREPPTARISALIASADLPLGLFKFQRRLKDIVDGGLADNLPVLPLLELAECDALVMISLDGKSRSLEDLRDDYVAKHKMQHLRHFTDVSPMEYGDPPKRLNVRSAEHFAQVNDRILYVTLPSIPRTLATLDFSPEALSDLYNQGVLLAEQLVLPRWLSE